MIDQGRADWALWFALMEEKRRTWPVTQLLVPVEELSRIVDAAGELGVSTSEFIELAVRERLEKELDIWPYAILNQNGPEPCFFCGDMTMLVDLAFEAPFCNSGICNWGIDEDLRMATV